MCEDDDVEALLEAVADRIDREFEEWRRGLLQVMRETAADRDACLINEAYEQWKQGLLDVWCALCEQPLHELDAVHTRLGLSHERCVMRLLAANAEEVE